MDPHPLPRLRFPWGKLILFCTLLGFGLLHYFPAPINRTLEMSAQSAEVPGSTTVTLQLHQDGTVTWRRPPTMDDQVWFLPKLGIEQTRELPTPTPVPTPSPWVAQTLKDLEKYEYKIDK